MPTPAPARPRPGRERLSSPGQRAGTSRKRSRTWSYFVSTVTIGPDGQPSAMLMSAESAAQLAQVLRQAFGGMAVPHGGFNPAEAAQMVGSHGGEQGTAVVRDARDVPAQPGFQGSGRRHPWAAAGAKLPRIVVGSR
jgi:hypothetical protein